MKLLKNKGFTLVELLVVIAILGVLAVIMIPAFTGYVAKAKQQMLVSNVESCYRQYKTLETAFDGGLLGEGLHDDKYSALTILANLEEFEIPVNCYLSERYEDGVPCYVVYYYEDDPRHPDIYKEYIFD
ncbi:MAG: type IV pilin protein [Erysipelotrichaceae bacterium]